MSGDTWPEAVLILRRNATRDYLDFVALAERLGPGGASAAMANFDELYPQSSGESALQQLQVQLARPLPFDLDEANLAQYRRLDARWHDWRRVTERCAAVAADIFRRL